MTDAQVEIVIATKISEYLAAIRPDEPDPEHLARMIIRALEQVGVTLGSVRNQFSDEAPGEQQVLVLPDRHDGVRVIVCAGEFDQRTLGPLSTVGAGALAESAVSRIVLDVSRVTFADSSMLNEMFRLRRGSSLVLVGPLPATLDRVLELTQARELFRIADDIEAARTL
ncbi:STAS domain-containing protein [Streptomyces sp. NPDC057939]|uniref:STAS domain-containing protein n=1 Tax=Streptomyces sp. NPDC057939 TaxID=3346284 RepID=UPI0036EBA7B1